MDGSGAPNKVTPIFIIILCIISAVFVLTIYHCIVITWCNPNRPVRWLRRHVRGLDTGEVSESAEFSTARLILPARVYSKEEGVVKEDQNTCVVCLSDFKDGEAVRLLPGCLHCFHVPCIDMWLMSHTSCPMCRTDTASMAVTVVETVE